MTDALTPISIMNISDFLIAQAEEQVRNAGLRIADQQAVVESLERRGYRDLTAHARALLAAFERFHKVMLRRLEVARRLAERRRSPTGRFGDVAHADCRADVRATPICKSFTDDRICVCTHRSCTAGRPDSRQRAPASCAGD
jgi:hypothetical protein